MTIDNFLSTSEVAKILGISRVAVFNRIKNGQIKAKKIGRAFVISKNELGGLLNEELSNASKFQIEAAVKKTVAEYGETLKLLGKS